MEREAVETSNQSAPCDRRDGRAPLSFPCSVMLSDGKFPCELLNLSLGGARIRTDRTLETGRTLWISLDEYQAFATVTWGKDGEYGLAFEDRLPKVIVMQMQGFSVNREEYEAAQSERAARNWALGDENRAPKSRLIRLLDVLGPKPRDTFASCAQCDSGKPCPTHCGHKQYRKHKNAYRSRVILYLGGAAIIGALLGIGSELIG